MRSTLRLFRGDEEATVLVAPKMTISFGHLTRVLTEAIHADRHWLTDFEHEEVELTQDLYEIVAAYQRVRPGA
jgi:translation initiation factor 2 alpha subunit (eIF-2alpha)